MDVKLSLVKYMPKCYSMNNTNNKYREMSYKEREGSRMSQNVHTEFVNKKVWEMFKKKVQEPHHRGVILVGYHRILPLLRKKS